MTVMGTHERPHLTTGQAAGLGVLGAALAIYCTLASYTTIADQALRLHVAFWRFTPAGYEGGLYTLMIFDLAMTWIDRPIWWLRYVAAVFAGGVVAANASAGWPNPIGILIRVAAPILLVVLVEGARHALLRDRRETKRQARAKARAEKHTNRIPWFRWLLDFEGTWAMWKRMKMWGIKSYPAAIALEQRYRVTLQKLTKAHGPGWRDQLPVDLVWQLDQGVDMDGTIARIDALIAPQPGTGERHEDHPKPRRKPHRNAHPEGRKNAQDEPLTTEARALKALEDNPRLRGPRMGKALADEIGVSPATGRRLHGQLAPQWHTERADADPETLTGDPGERAASDTNERSG